MSDAASKYPGWEADEFGTRTLTFVIAGEQVRLATVLHDTETGLNETYTGLPVSTA